MTGRTEKKGGVIYILTNPSFPEYVKIGYADDIKKRLKQLNRSECIPFAFRVYATYEVTSRLSDLKLHSIIDKLNPNLRSIETFDGKQRIREFYAMDPEDAYSILSAIAEINNCEDKLHRVLPNADEIEDEKTAEEIESENRERKSPIDLGLCEIPVGAELEFYNTGNPNSGRRFRVIDNHKVEYEGKPWSLSALAAKLLGSKWSVQGPSYFRYDGELLTDRRERLGV